MRRSVTGGPLFYLWEWLGVIINTKLSSSRPQNERFRPLNTMFQHDSSEYVYSSNFSCFSWEANGFKISLSEYSSAF